MTLSSRRIQVTGSVPFAVMLRPTDSRKRCRAMALGRSILASVVCSFTGHGDRFGSQGMPSAQRNCAPPPAFLLPPHIICNRQLDFPL
jgi:hypothetical protein